MILIKCLRTVLVLKTELTHATRMPLEFPYTPDKAAGKPAIMKSLELGTRVQLAWCRLMLRQLPPTLVR